MRRKMPALGAGLRTKKGSASKVWSKESVSSLIGHRHPITRPFPACSTGALSDLSSIATAIGPRPTT